MYNYTNLVKNPDISTLFWQVNKNFRPIIGLKWLKLTVYKEIIVNFVKYHVLKMFSQLHMIFLRQKLIKF